MQEKLDGELAQSLIAGLARCAGMTPESIGRSSAYQAFIDGAGAAGLTGPNMAMDDEFSSRSAQWLAEADADQIVRWVHTLLRIERANYEWPNAVLEALQDGRLAAAAGALMSPATQQ